MTTDPAAAGVPDGSPSDMMAPGSVKTARTRANVAMRTAYLDDWERRLKQREEQLVHGEDALEDLAMLYSRRSVTVLRALRLQTARDSAGWYMHVAGVLLFGLILTAVVGIAINWSNKNFQCNKWEGMASWGIMGYTFIAGLSYIARNWLEDRAIAANGTAALVSALLIPFLNLTTCLSAALWSVSISSMCHAA